MAGDGTALRFRRVASGLCLVMAPLGQLVSNAIVPRSPLSPADFLRVVAEHRGAYLASDLIGIPALALYVPAVYGLVHLMRGRGAVVGTVGAWVLGAGALFLAGFLAVGFVYLGMVDPSADRQEMVALLARYNRGVGFWFLFGAFIACFQLGSLLLGVGLRRTGAVPRWVSSVVILAAILSALAAPFGFAEIVSPALLTVGLGAIGVRTLATSDREWARSDFERSR